MSVKALTRHISSRLEVEALRDNARVIIVYVVLALMVAVTSTLSPVFRSQVNIFNVLRQSVILGVLAIGQAFTILSAGIDLSVGSVVKLIAVLSSGFIAGETGMVVPIILLCLTLGGFIGLLNGLMIAKVKISPFVATLAMFSILRGFAYAYTRTAIGAIPEAMRFVLYGGAIGPVPVVVILFVILLVLGIVVLRQTRFGRHLYAVGGNEEVARLAGIEVGRIRIGVYILCGVLAALAGLIKASSMGLGDPIVGEGLELDSITAVILGGISFAGGSGGLVGTLAGVFILALINNVLTLLRVSWFYQGLIKAFIVLIAVAIYKQKA